MPVGNLVMVGGRPCLDFCNTVENRGKSTQVEFLDGGYPGLVRWSEAATILSPAEARQLLSAMKGHEAKARTVFKRAYNFREMAWRIFDAIVEGRKIQASMLSALDAAAAEYLPRRRLARTESGSFEMHWPADPSLDRMIGPLVLSMVELLTEEDLSLLKRCPGCGWFFLDKSRNRSRTWCDMRFCGNRAKAKRHQQRERS